MVAWVPGQTQIYEPCLAPPRFGSQRRCEAKCAGRGRDSAPYERTSAAGPGMVSGSGGVPLVLTLFLNKHFLQQQGFDKKPPPPPPRRRPAAAPPPTFRPPPPAPRAPRLCLRRLSPIADRRLEPRRAASCARSRGEKSATKRESHAHTRREVRGARRGARGERARTPSREDRGYIHACASPSSHPHCHRCRLIAVVIAVIPPSS